MSDPIEFLHKNDCNCNVALAQKNCMAHLKMGLVSIILICVIQFTLQKQNWNDKIGTNQCWKKIYTILIFYTLLKNCSKFLLVMLTSWLA